MTNLQIQLKPGPKVLAAALMLAGFSPTSYYPPVIDAAKMEWPKPSGLQIALALCGGESSGNAWAYRVNTDAHHSVDYGLLEINEQAHPELFAQYDPLRPTAWNWMNYLDNAKAAYQIHAASNWGWGAWKAYTGGGYLAIRVAPYTWLHWAQFGINQMMAARSVLMLEGKTEAEALSQIASVNNDPLIY